MFATMNNAADAYRAAGIESQVGTASPHELVLLLFDGALLSIAKAENAMQQGGIADKGKAISSAIDIVANGLRASLKFSAGDELPERLAALYDYMCSRLLHANLHNDQAALKEVSRLLTEIMSAWEEIGNHPVPVSASKVVA